MAARDHSNLKLPALQVNGKNMFSSNDDDHEDPSGAVGAVTLAWASMPGTPNISASVEQLMNINRQLVTQIEVLQMKQQVDSNKREVAINGLLDSSNQRLKSRESEVEHLKSSLQQKGETLKVLTEENQRKDGEIIRLQEYVKNLRADVQDSKGYAEQLQRQLDKFSKIPRNTASDCREKDKEIADLQTEVHNLKEHLMTLDHELKKAKDTLAQQGCRLRIMERDKGNLQIKFKEDLAKVTSAVRNEIEKLREVMSLQWKTMTELRDQSKQLNQGIQEIREMIVAQQNPGQVHNHNASNNNPEIPSTPAVTSHPEQKINKQKTNHRKNKY